MSELPARVPDGRDSDLGQDSGSVRDADDILRDDAQRLGYDTMTAYYREHGLIPPGEHTREVTNWRWDGCE